MRLRRYLESWLPASIIPDEVPAGALPGNAGFEPHIESSSRAADLGGACLRQSRALCQDNFRLFETNCVTRVVTRRSTARIRLVERRRNDARAAISASMVDWSESLSWTIPPVELALILASSFLFFANG